MKVVIFDLDGTLLDTSSGIICSVRHTIENLGLSSLSEKEIETFVGPPVQESFKRYYNMGDEAAQRAAEVFREYYKGKSLFLAEVYPGIIQILSSLRDKGFKVAIATYKRHDYTMTLLDKFGITSYCDVIHGADNDNKLKKADIITLCMRDLGASLEECVLIGDTEHDARGAQILGMDFIGVGYGFGFKEQNDLTLFPNIGFCRTVKDLSQWVMTNT